MPIIVGTPRSGTTLLRFMIDAHPWLAIPPETGFLATIAEQSDTLSRDDLHRIITTYPPNFPGWKDFGIDAGNYNRRLRQVDPFTIPDGVREFYRLYAAKHGKLRYGDKTPIYCRHMRAIEALLPEAHFIHIIRDGRDVAVSLRKVWFAPGKDMTTLAAYWSDFVLSARQAGLSTSRYIEVRYESLVTDPEAVLRTVCEFIGLDFDPVMLSYWRRTPERLREHRSRRSTDGSLVVTREQRIEQQRLTMHPPDAGRVLAWRTELTAAEQSEFDRTAGDALAQFGYNLTPTSQPRAG
jgi:hypothetical protein